MSSRGRAGEKVEQEGGPDPGAAWAEALEHFSAMSVPERAAEVLKMVAPAIAESCEKASFKHGAEIERRLGEVNPRLERIEAAVGEGLWKR